MVLIAESGVVGRCFGSVKVEGLVVALRSDIVSLFLGLDTVGAE
jgi:hypothetical protein